VIRILRFCLLGALLVATGVSTATAAETERQYLSGKNKDDAVTWDFSCNVGQNANKPSTIKVPSNWELQGFGVYTYGRDKFPQGWPAVVGRYKRTFTSPASWSDRKVFLVFEGSMTDTEASINGQSVGPKHQGGYYCFKYDVTKLLKLGQDNLLEVTVNDESANPSVNRAERRGDYWNYGGIYRPVYLEAVPQQFIDRVAIDAKADGTLNADIVTQGASPAMNLESQVLDLDGKPVGPPTVAAPGASVLSGKLDNPRLWTAETPNLYQLEVRLKQGDTVVHSVRQRFGFRTIEVREPGPGVDNPGLFVNGQRVMLKGCCRHSFWPDSGRCLSEQISRDDVLLMKEMNMNAVRCSHYPPDSHFLDACDELGLYVLDEIAGWHAHYDTPVGRTLVEEMVTHDVNHPSILFWDNGNEGGFNNDLNDDYAKWDIQKRNVLHPWELFRGIDTKHYPNYADLLTKCSGDNIYFATEMLHGLYDGGAGASLDDYWKVMRASKVSAGGFIWAFLDEDVRRTDLGGKLDSRGNQAPDGIVGPYREREGSFYAIKQVWSPIVIARTADPNAFTIENRYDFLDAKDCSFTWEYRHFPRPTDSASGYKVLLSGKALVRGSVPPGASGKLELQLGSPVTLPAGIDAVALTAKDPQGHEVWTWVWPQSSSWDDPQQLVHAAANAKITTTETPDVLTVTVNDLVIRFTKRTGMIDTVKRGKTFALYNGPRLVTGSGTLTNFTAKPDGDDLVISATYSGDLQSIAYRIHPNGWITMDYAYHLTGPHDFFGLGFDYAEGAVRSMRYLGNGPYRVWKNRLAGGTLNVWEKTYNNTVTGDPDDSNANSPDAGKLIYPEFKGFYSGVRWIQLQTGEGLITAIINDPSQMFVQVLNPQLPPTRLQGKTGVAFPTTDVAFLDAIPPIGSKFVPPNITGPSAQQAIAQGDYRHSVSLFFGELPH
jgi:hypothetical protein